MPTFTDNMVDSVEADKCVKRRWEKGDKKCFTGWLVIKTGQSLSKTYSNYPFEGKYEGYSSSDIANKLGITMEELQELVWLNDNDGVIAAREFAHKILRRYNWKLM